MANAYQTLFDALNENWAAYAHALQCSRNRAGAKPVHDLRTSLRRLTADLELIQALEPKCREAAELHRSLKKELDALRNLRDLQVERKELRGPARGSPELGKLLEVLDRERRKEKKNAEKELSRVHSKRQLRALSKVNEALLGKPHSSKELEQARRRVLGEVQRRYQDLARASREAVPSDPPSLHQARIRFKKFRYAWEAAAPLIAGHERQEKRLKELQDLLGDVQDATVLLGTLEQFDGSHKKAQRDRKLRELRTHLGETRERLSRRFVQERDSALRALRPPRSRAHASQKPAQKAQASSRRPR
jgi:CHAD domain-containing protein